MGGQFLDEADLLADDIAILAAPGKLLAQGSPVSLKSRLGEGYVVTISATASPDLILGAVRTHAPQATQDTSDPNTYILHTKDAQVVGNVLDTLEAEKKELGIDGYDVRGTSMEAIFLGLMGTGEGEEVVERDELAAVQSKEGMDLDLMRRLSRPELAYRDASPLPLSDGRKTSPLRQALTGFHKRVLILRRSWLSYVLMVAIAVAGACVPLVFLSNRTDTCSYMEDNPLVQPLYLPEAASALLWFGEVSLDSFTPLISPPNLLNTIGLQYMPHTPIQGTENFTNTLRANYRNLSLGGLDVASGYATLAWEASSGSMAGMTLLNLANNILAVQSLGSGAPRAGRIIAYFQDLPVTWVLGTVSMSLAVQCWTLTR